MAPVFSGALMPKKKSELQDISIALKISDQGTKDELLARIKRHLELNPDLEDEPSFAGLFGSRRKRSVQPQPIVSSLKPASSATDSGKSRGRRGAALDSIRESTPINDLRDVSTFLKQAPFDSPLGQSPRAEVQTTPSSLPPLPPSPSKSIIERLPNPQEIEVFTQKIQANELLQNGIKMLERFRQFLSSSQNIWSLTALAEILYILQTMIPWKTLQVPLFKLQDSPVNLSIHYPPWSVFQTYAFWMVILHWALPTLIIPAIVGNLVSFNPRQLSSQLSNKPPIASTPFDPLTASIIRVAAQIGYPYDAIEKNVPGLDVLGLRWRVLNASVGLAFAFAEAIAGSPQTFAQTLATEQRYNRLLEGPSASEDHNSITRRALMPSEAVDETEEVD